MKRNKWLSDSAIYDIIYLNSRISVSLMPGSTRFLTEHPPKHQKVLSDVASAHVTRMVPYEKIME